ncbi:anaerobic glycerol-3-phosphate dehydrogenase subunit C [Planctomicrobium piriforme]|uniref:FAD/FMN-containing dehydrogenase n=1 Tax=Planctomicrobium piriforme TaxID=1576369 RepID=A0A1I3G3H5_9PLAN|nr:anaerobic glycerol-3-phosphate dehydrogenase subunit C [Planctomicrobium piriforme]SFI18030.1 FAD/FMN-containing dehydrogenase [Planctomicrobium piriforme]
MDDQQQRIAEDLAGLFQGELRFDEVAREAYSTDASIYQIRPAGVAYPRHREDVATLAQYAHECRMPLIARGAGSGLAGGALGRGLIVDFSRHLTGIGELTGDTVRVQAGVVRNQLNAFLRPLGRYFAPDPASTAVTTVGGMLAVDAAGSHAVRVGSVRDHVESIEAVLADGSLFEAARHHRWVSEGDSPRRNEIVTRVNQIVTEHQQLIAERQPRGRRNCSAYHLQSVLQGDQVDLTRLLIGSEGTLAMFTAATLQTLPLPAHRGAALVLFRDLEQALEAVQEIAQLQPSACDLMDRRVLSLARDASPRFAELIPTTAEAGLLIEHTGYSDRQTREWLSGMLQRLREIDPTAMIAAEATTFEEVEFLWSLPSRVVPLLNQLRGETRPIPLVEDIAVPPAALREFLIKAQRVFQKHWMTASLYAHAASGQVHFRPFMKPPSPENAAQIESLARELYEVAFSFGGTISGEHGNGLARTAFIRSEYGPLYRILQKVKEVFDPENLLNPGKIISDDPHLTVRNFRDLPIAVEEDNPLVPLLLHWETGEFAETTLRCTGCGDCRLQSDVVRMCPFFHVDQLEDASPRAKANLMRSLATGAVDPKTFSTDQAKELADLCFNCKQCHLECPSQVNIPALATEAKAQCVAAMGLSSADYILSRAHSFGRLGCRISPLANWAIAHSGVRWLGEKLLGISQHRRLPKFARGEFLKSVRNSSANLESAKAVYFVDHFVNYHDHELGRAFLRIMEHNGIAVAVPQEQVATGMAMVSVGDLDAARELAETNVRILAEYAREGRPIICTEPTAAVCLKYEYPRLLQQPDVQLVAEHTIEAGAYLMSLHQAGNLKTNFEELPIEVGYHTPCHLRYLGQETPLATLLSLIPGITVKGVEHGCSGMAGAFGITARNFEKSLAMGAGLLAEMAQPKFQAGATECSSCRMQMEQAASIATLHPLKLLAIAYGLMPELRDRLSKSAPSGLLLS